MKKLSSLGFTLIELMVVIAIIGVLAITGSRLNFNKISDTQYIRIFTGKIVTLYETTRNNMLIGRSVLSAGTTAYSWKIEIPIGSGKTMRSYYNTGSGLPFSPYTISDYNYKSVEEISKISCYTATGSTSTTPLTSGTGVIVIDKDTTSFSGTTNGSITCDNTTKIIKIETKYHSNTGSVEINAMSGLITTSY